MLTFADSTQVVTGMLAGSGRNAVGGVLSIRLSRWWDSIPRLEFGRSLLLLGHIVTHPAASQLFGFAPTARRPVVPTGCRRPSCPGDGERQIVPLVPRAAEKAAQCRILPQNNGFWRRNRARMMTRAVEIRCSTWVSWDMYCAGAHPVRSNRRPRPAQIMRYCQMATLENRKDNQ